MCPHLECEQCNTLVNYNQGFNAFKSDLKNTWINHLFILGLHVVVKMLIYNVLRVKFLYVTLCKKPFLCCIL